MEFNNLDPHQHYLKRGKDMTEAEAHTIKQEYKEMKKTYHMALDMIEAEKEKNRQLDRASEVKFKKSPSSMTTQKDKLADLDKKVAVISERINTIQNNHLKHIEEDISAIRKVMWSVGFLVFTNLVILLRDLFYKILYTISVGSEYSHTTWIKGY